MDNQTLPTLPVVIVGKDRTRMTCAVIDALLNHIKEQLDDMTIPARQHGRI